MPGAGFFMLNGGYGGLMDFVEAEATRESTIAPSTVRRISCKPTDHPDVHVGIA